MTWFWIWFLLVLGALVVLGLLGWRVVRAGFAVMGDIGRVGERADDTARTSTSGYDEWLVGRAAQDAADAERRQAEGRSGPARRTMASPDFERS